MRLPGLTALMLGVQELFFPLWFHDTFPFGRGWLRSEPYDGHILTDAGGLYLGAAVLLLALPASSPTRIRRLVLVSWLVSAVSHLTYHVVAHADLPTGDRITEVGLLGVIIVVPLAAALTGDVATATGRPPPDRRSDDYGRTDDI